MAFIISKQSQSKWSKNIFSIQLILIILFLLIIAAINIWASPVKSIAPIVGVVLLLAVVFYFIKSAAYNHLQKAIAISVASMSLCFFLLKEEGHHLLPTHIKVKSNKQLVRSDNSAIQNSLFDYVLGEDLNETEKSVAMYLDEQEQLLWWYRNRVRKDFHIQG